MTTPTRGWTQILPGTTIYRQGFYIDERILILSSKGHFIPSNQQTTKKNLPNIEYPVLGNYPGFNPFPYTEMKACKSTTTWTYFQSGFVKDTIVWHLDTTDLFIILSNVRINDSLLFKSVCVITVIHVTCPVANKKFCQKKTAAYGNNTKNL